jgi:hypothetical protein
MLGSQQKGPGQRWLTCSRHPGPAAVDVEGLKDGVYEASEKVCGHPRLHSPGGETGGVGQPSQGPPFGAW